jgi:dienelactone hydrolase
MAATMGMGNDVLRGFRKFQFTREDISHEVHVTGTGPPVLIMHELPGLTPSALGLGRRLAKAGFTTYLPLLFGEAGMSEVTGSYRQLCVSREFARLEAGVSAPIVDWLRGLAGELSTRHGGSNVGAIGMCLTGAFVIPLILEPCVTAPVAAQPGVPFSVSFRAIGIGRGEWMTQINVSDADLDAAAARARAENLSLLATRFESDRICPAERLDRLQQAFGERLLRRELPGGSTWRQLAAPRHATLTEEYDRAPDRPDEPTRVLFAEVVSFLRERLV